MLTFRVYALNKRLDDAIKETKEESDELKERIHGVKNSQTRIIVTFSVVMTLLLGLVAFAAREALLSWPFYRNLLGGQQIATDPIKTSPVTPEP